MAAVPPGIWAECKVCRLERRVSETGRIVAHSRWNYVVKIMVECEGSGLLPLGWPPQVGSQVR